MQENIYDQTRAFQFNLVPPKSKAELVVLEQRDNSILYSFLLIFFAMFIYFVLNLILTFVINQRIDQSKAQIVQQESSFTAYDEIKRIKGELITKGQLLEPVLKKDIKLTQLLDLGKKITDDNPTVGITTYSRETTGEFVLIFSVPDVPTVSKLVEYLNKDAEVSNVFARNIQYQDDDKNLNAIISFYLNNL